MIVVQRVEDQETWVPTIVTATKFNMALEDEANESLDRVLMYVYKNFPNAEVFVDERSWSVNNKGVTVWEGVRELRPVVYQ